MCKNKDYITFIFFRFIHLYFVRFIHAWWSSLFIKYFIKKIWVFTFRIAKMQLKYILTLFFEHKLEVPWICFWEFCCIPVYNYSTTMYILYHPFKNFSLKTSMHSTGGFCFKFRYAAVREDVMKSQKILQPFNVASNDKMTDHKKNKLLHIHNGTKMS